MIAMRGRQSSQGALMLAAADRVFVEFDGLPVKTVFQAILAARGVLRDRGEPATPQAVEATARALLRSGDS